MNKLKLTVFLIGALLLVGGKIFLMGFEAGRTASDEEAFQAYIGIAQNAKAYKAAQSAKPRTAQELMASLGR